MNPCLHYPLTCKGSCLEIYGKTKDGCLLA